MPTNDDKYNLDDDNKDGNDDNNYKKESWWEAPHHGADSNYDDDDNKYDQNRLYAAKHVVSRQEKWKHMRNGLAGGCGV